MQQNPSLSKIRSAVYVVLSFVLSLLLCLFTLSIFVKAILLNSDLVISVMDTSGYFIDKSDEITVSLTDLGCASGLDPEFFEGLVDETLIYNDTLDYLERFYSGEGVGIDTTEFERKFNDEIDKYISENSIGDVRQNSRDLLVSKLALIYKSSLELPLCGTLSGYVKMFGNSLIYIIIGLAVFIAVLCLIIIKTNKWKHRAVRYIYYSVAGSALALTVFPAIVLFSGFMKRLHMSSRAMYNMIVQYSNNLMIALLVFGGFLLLVAVLLFLVCRNMRAKVS